MVPSTTCLSDTLLKMDEIMDDAEQLITIGRRDDAAFLIASTSETFISVLSQFGPQYFSIEEVEKIKAYYLILKVVSQLVQLPNEEYEDDDEGEEIYDW